jgi:hypothetical protein
MRVSVMLSASFCLCSACIVEAPGGDKSPERERSVVQQIPALSSNLGARLDGKVELVAATVQPGRIKPGEQSKVTLYFKPLEELDKEYVVFVHVEDADGRSFRLNLDHRPAGGNYPTTRWRKGETIKDEFALQIPPNTSVRRVNVWAGLWEPQADVRLRLLNPDTVKNDGSNRVLVAQVPIAQ